MRSCRGQSVIRRRFGSLITVNLKDIEQQVARTTKSDDVLLRVQTITLPLPKKVNQAVIAKRLQEAEALQSKFSGCRATKVLTRQNQGRQVQGFRPSQIQQH